MILYIAVTPDHLELPMFVADTAEEMAAWAGVKVQTVKTNCSRNRNKPPFLPEEKRAIASDKRMRRIVIEEDES